MMVDMSANGRSEESMMMNYNDESETPLSSPDEGAGTAVLERPETREQTEHSDGGDADRFAHYVSKERIAQSRLTGRPVVALCGKVWVPKHDPSQYPVCPDCKRIYEEMQRGN
jgi:hypothetical protein